MSAAVEEVEPTPGGHPDPHHQEDCLSADGEVVVITAIQPITVSGEAAARGEDRRSRAFLSPVLFLLCVCFVVFGDAASDGVLAGITTSLEIRYHLTATDLGILETAFSAGNMVALPFVSYFGGRPGANRPKWIATGALGMAVGAMLTSLPQFLFRRYHAGVLLANGEVRSLECTMDSAEDECDNVQEVDAQNKAAYWIMFIGAVVTGIGYAAVPSLALSYIDDNCEIETTALYAGIMESMYGVGSILGFLISSYSLSLWVDFYHRDSTPNISPDHPAWVGAWWIGLLVCCAIFVVSSVPIFCFPSRLPPRRPARGQVGGTAEATSPNATATDRGETQSTRRQNGLLKTYLKLMRNPVLLFVTLGMMCEFAMLESFRTFLAKYMESQFEITASSADLLTGVATVPTYGIGWIVGGVIIKKTKMGLEAMFFFSTCCSVASLACFVLMLFLGCSDPSIAGVSVGYPGQSLSGVSLVADCNVYCDCTTSSYHPVCDVTNDVTYISPCFAGCNDTIDSVYHNCSCLDSPSGSAVVAGICAFDCNMLVPFIVVLVIQTTATTMAGVPRLMLLLRFVDPKDKTSALGFNQIFTSLGGILGPIIYAVFIDLTCNVWQSVCETRGACLVYDIELYRNYFIGLSVVMGVLSLTLTCPGYHFIRKKARSGQAPSGAELSQKIITLNLMKKRNSTINFEAFITRGAE